MPQPIIARRAGFTLIELLVVVLIIGILGALSMTHYAKTVETSKADDAASVVKIIGTANRMFQLDNGNYVNNGTINNVCNATACSGSSYDRCQLVACKYLASQKWDGLPYSFDAGQNVSCGLSLSCSTAKRIACAKRSTTQPGGTNSAPYKNWGYIYCSDGTIQTASTAPVPPT
ncbi:MAG: type II secretion system protein [Elusimicrobiota bacterium]